MQGFTINHDAEAFCLLSRRCFCLIHAEGAGHAQHCPYLTERPGRFKDNAGKWHTAKACNGHRADLDSVHRISSFANFAKRSRGRDAGSSRSALERTPAVTG